MLTIRKKLLPSWYPLPGEHNGPAPEFLLAPLNAGQYLDLRNCLSLESGDIIMTGSGAAEAVAAAVRDWRNVVDEAGTAINFNPTLLPDFPADVIRRLAIEILNRAALWESERKN